MTIIHHCTAKQVRQLMSVFAYPAVGPTGRLIWRIPGWLRSMRRHVAKKPKG